MSNNRQDAIRAWDEYLATSLHITQDEADAWLGKLEAGHDVEPPACRVLWANRRDRGGAGPQRDQLLKR